MKKLTILIIFSMHISRIAEELIITNNSNIILSGTNSFIFDQYSNLGNKTVEVFYHIPPQSSINTRILFIVHGADRNLNKKIYT